MKTEIVCLTVTIAAAAALSRFRLVSFAGAPTGAGARAMGVAVTSFSSGEQAGVAVRGELLVEAGAAVAVGAQVESDSSSRAITLASGVPFGVARDAAAAAGDIIRVLV